MENAICAVQLPQSLEVSSQQDMDSNYLQSFQLPFLKTFISITSNPDNPESKLKNIKTFNVPARATINIAPNSNSSLLKKGWNKISRAEECACSLVSPLL